MVSIFLPINSMNLTGFSGESCGASEVMTSFQSSGLCMNEYDDDIPPGYIIPTVPSCVNSLLSL